MTTLDTIASETPLRSALLFNPASNSYTIIDDPHPHLPWKDRPCREGMWIEVTPTGWAYRRQHA